MSTHVIARVILPGVSREDLKVEVHDTHLSISARRIREWEQRKEIVYHRERPDGGFFRTILLPDGVNVREIQASFADGVLEVRAPAPSGHAKKGPPHVDSSTRRSDRPLRPPRAPMVEIRNILCPLDFSDHSRHALTHAAGLASWYGASISAFHVQEISAPAPVIDPLVPPGLATPFVPVDGNDQDGLERLNEFVRASQAADVKIEVAVEESPDASDAIVARAKRVAADLVTLGTNGGPSSRQHVLGTVAEKVLRTAPCPILAVAFRSDDGPYGPVGFRRIVCPVDFSEGSLRALEYAAGLARDVNARLTVVHVVELVSELAAVAPDFDEHREVRLEPARRALKTSISPAIRESCAVEELLQMGDPHEEILRLAEEQRAGLIVMGARGSGSKDGARLGATIKAVVPAAKCPVIVVP